MMDRSVILDMRWELSALIYGMFFIENSGLTEDL